MDAYCRNGIWIHEGDCRVIMRDFPSASIASVITDPPYLVNYQGRWDGARKTIVGDKDSDWLRPAFTEIWRLLKEDSFCVSFYGWPHCEVFVGLWKELRFRLVSHLVFVKRVWGLGRFRRGQHETAFLLAKGHPKVPAKGISNVIYWEREETAFHPNQKPVGALYPLLSAYVPTGGVVLDPFMGSGSTLRAAKDMGLKAVGIEIEPDYCRQALARLAQEVLFPLTFEF